MSKRCVSTAAILFLFLFLFAACGSSSSAGNGDSGAGQPGGDAGGCTAPGAGCHDDSCPCTLLTQAEVAAAVGVPVGPGVAAGNACAWTYSPQPDTAVLTVSLATNINPATFSMVCGTPPGHGVTTTKVSGVGDAACFVTTPGLGGTVLNFQKNCWGYDFNIFPDSTHTSTYPASKLETFEKALALEVVAKF
jgi:hypothetical protein